MENVSWASVLRAVRCLFIWTTAVFVARGTNVTNVTNHSVPDAAVPDNPTCPGEFTSGAPGNILCPTSSGNCHVLVDEAQWVGKSTCQEVCFWLITGGAACLGASALKDHDCSSDLNTVFVSCATTIRDIEAGIPRHILCMCSARHVSSLTSIVTTSNWRSTRTSTITTTNWRSTRTSTITTSNGRSTRTSTVTTLNGRSTLPQFATSTTTAAGTGAVDSGAHVDITGDFIVNNVDFAALEADPQLRYDFRVQCLDTIRSEAGTASSANDQVILRAGSVFVGYSITVPRSSSAAVRNSLSTASVAGGSLATNLAAALSALPGIASTRTGGRISVTGITGPRMPLYDVVSGLCVAQGNCLSSPNFPFLYGNAQGCTIQTDSNSWGGRVIRVEAFTTEAVHDRLSVNGVDYSGAGVANGPGGITPSGYIRWTTDFSVQNTGWKICADITGTPTVGTPAPAAVGNSSDDDDDPFGIVLAVFGGACLICCCCCACYVVRQNSASKRKVAPAPSPVPSPAPAVARDTPAGGSPASVKKEESRDKGLSSVVPSADTSISEPTTSHGSQDVPKNFQQAPAYWNHKDLSVDFIEREQVEEYIEEIMQQAVDQTYKSVKTRDRKEGELPTKFKVVNVMRMENSKLWRKYTTARYGMKMKRPHKCTPATARGGDVLSEKALQSLEMSLDHSINETLLWHGTSPSAAQNIQEEGFKLARSGENAGSLYGKGLYFAECSSKSDEYAQDDREGNFKGLFCLLLCRVVLGEQLFMTAGGSSTHKMIDEALKSGAYDSVLGDRQASVGTYREFVNYDDGLVYPEYLLIYKRVF